ncbi:hypothetical protein KSP40_PGU021198 [Platanthera guangdongensis]|uniref:tRNA nucleotidyltransferase/poly(A) polymerase RNA and SrmB- binding domain-containing protein n=1 Tax=Platanthera guangdongensis TaxID=2320717 RepID=A0ABR2MWD3_9ASPA
MILISKIIFPVNEFFDDPPGCRAAGGAGVAKSDGWQIEEGRRVAFRERRGEGGRAAGGAVVERAFSRCAIVGKRFPICHVYIDDYIVEVRTIIPARISFQEDCARILRAIRIAARLEFRFTRETAQCIKELAALVGRILMEMNYMLSYGSAEASLRLLWKFGLLELLLPIQVGMVEDKRCGWGLEMQGWHGSGCHVVVYNSGN